MKIWLILLIIIGVMSCGIESVDSSHTEPDTAITIKSYTKSRCQLDSVKCDIKLSQDIMDIDTSALTIGVSYSRKDYRKWGWEKEGEGVPLYFRWPYTEIGVLYTLSPGIRAALPSHGSLKLRGHLFYKHGGATFYHKWIIDKKTRLLFYRADRSWMNTIADYLKITIVRTHNKISEEIGSCKVQIPKYECTADYEVPWAAMCNYSNINLSCQVRLK